MPPPARGVRFVGGAATMTQCPFLPSGEAVGGCWMIRVASGDEAIDRASRCPAGEGDLIDLRQIQDVEGFPPESLPRGWPDLGLPPQRAEDRTTAGVDL